MPVPARCLRVGVVLLLSLSPGLVEESSAEQGGLAILGIGTGSGTIMCTQCTHAGNMGGSTATIQVVWLARPHLCVGFTADWWWHFTDTWERGTWDFTPAAFYYPFSRRRFFIGGGPSYSMILATVNDSAALTRHGWGFATEMGYDVAPRRLVAFTPYIQYSWAWVGNIDYPLGSNVTFARGWKHDVLSVGLGLTFHESHR